MAEVKRATQSVAGGQKAPDETLETQQPTDAAILEKASCDVTLGRSKEEPEGRTYHWDELGNRRSRDAKVRMLETRMEWDDLTRQDCAADPTLNKPKEFKERRETDAQGKKKVISAESVEWEWISKHIVPRHPDVSTRHVNWMLDFLLEFNLTMEADRQFLEDNADDDEILVAFVEVVAVINAPFLRAAAKAIDEAARESQKSRTRTT